MNDATPEEKEQHKTWLMHPMTERLQQAIAKRKIVLFEQLAVTCVDGSVDRIRACAGRLQGLQDVEFFIKKGML
jgi:hypothetical protein